MNTHVSTFETVPTPVAGTSFNDKLDALRRRARPAWITLGSLLALTLLVAVLWPPTYRSAGTVLIEQQEVPKEFVRAAITSFADQRVRATSQRVMTTSNLLEIMRKYDLYPEMRRREPREKLLERMRDDIGLEMISADVVDPAQGRPTKATIAFTVSFDHGSPLVAAKVANELTTLYLNENLESRKKLAAGTADFLREEVERVSAEVADIERRIADFKTGQGDALPELGQINIQLMARTDEELRNAQTQASALDQQVVYLDAQLAQLDPVGGSFTEGGARVMTTSQRLKTLRTQLASASALYSPTHPDVLRLQREIMGLEREVGESQTANDLVRQLNDAKSQLAQARTRYSPSHPDVVRLERIVEAIDSAMRQSSSTAASFASSESPDNPAYVQIKAQREAAVTERAALRSQIAELRGRTADYESRLARAPAVERQYSAMLRELEGAQLKYQEVRQKQMEAQLASNLEVEQKGERFTLIDPPLVPEKPISPNIPLVIALGVLLSLASALGLAMFMDQTDDSVRSRLDLSQLLAVPPLAVVPRIETNEDRDAHRRGQRVWLASAVGGLLTLLLLVHFMWRPLDVVWQILLRRLGI